MFDFLISIFFIGCVVYVISFFASAARDEKRTKRYRERLQIMASKYPDAYLVLCGPLSDLNTMHQSKLQKLAEIDEYTFQKKQRDILEGRQRALIREQELRRKEEQVSSWCEKYPYAVEELIGRRRRLTEDHINKLLGFSELYLKNKQEQIIAERSAKAASLCKKYPNAVEFYIGYQTCQTPNDIDVILAQSESILDSKEQEIIAKRELQYKRNLRIKRADQAKAWCNLYPEAVKEILKVSNLNSYLTTNQVDTLLVNTESWLKDREEKIQAEKRRIKEENAQKDRGINERLDFLNKTYPEGLAHVKKLRSERVKCKEIYTDDEWKLIQKGHAIRIKKAPLTLIPNHVYEKFQSVAIRYNKYRVQRVASELIFDKVRYSRAKMYNGWNRSTRTTSVCYINLYGTEDVQDLSVFHLFLNSNASSSKLPEVENIVDIITSIPQSSAVIISNNLIGSDEHSEEGFNLQYFKDRLNEECIRCISIRGLKLVKNVSAELLVIFEQVTTDDSFETNCNRVYEEFGGIPILYISLYKEYGSEELNKILQKEEALRLKEAKRKEKEKQELKERLAKEAERKAREEAQRLKLEAAERARLEQERIRREHEERRIREAEEKARREREEKARLERAERARREREEQERRERERKEQERKEIIRNYLQTNGFTCFYHFTDRDNLESIKAHGGLYSWDYCVRNGIHIPHPGGSQASRDLDCRRHLEDYVRLSFCDDHPMKFSLKQQGRDLVLLKIKLDVAELESTKFSDINATDNDCTFGTGIDYLRKVDVNAVKEHFVKKDSPNFKKHQAEIMVKTHVPLEKIINIDSPQTLK